MCKPRHFQPCEKGRIVIGFQCVDDGETQGPRISDFYICLANSGDLVMEGPLLKVNSSVILEFGEKSRRRYTRECPHNEITTESLYDAIADINGLLQQQQQAR